MIDALSAVSRAYRYELKRIVTKGDRIQKVTLSKIGGKGLFVKEIERELLDGEIDFAVHSMKDVPAELPEGLEIAAVPKREDASDVLISRTGTRFNELPYGSVIGTSSLRRAAQLLHARPELVVRPVRGNVDTRLNKLRNGAFDAIVLAASGLKRLGLPEAARAEPLPEDVSLPAIGQGALAIECRSDDADLKKLLESIDDPETHETVLAERAFLKRLGGSCQVPIAARCKKRAGYFELTGLVASPDGRKLLKTRCNGEVPQPLGLRAAEELLGQGAGEILAACEN